MERCSALLCRVWLPAFLRSPYPQEYLCLGQGARDDLWRFELDGEDISGRHLFLGYRPLVVAVEGDRPSAGELLLRSTHQRRTVAGILLKRIDLPGIGSGITFFTGTRAWSRFLPWSQWPLDRVRRWRNARKRGNVATVPAEIDMTRIMYAQPREIHLAVVGSPGRCNIFPTDLHGTIRGRYLISLRHAGKACAQVMEQGSFALFQMAPDRYKDVYALAPRHMGEPTAASTIAAIDGSWNGAPRPAGAHAARRLSIGTHHDAGIHRIFQCRIDRDEKFSRGPVLAHVHASPASWLLRHGHPLEVRLR